MACVEKPLADAGGGGFGCIWWLGRAVWAGWPGAVSVSLSYDNGARAHIVRRAANNGGLVAQLVRAHA